MTKAILYLITDPVLLKRQENDSLKTRCQYFQHHSEFVQQQSKINEETLFKVYSEFGINVECLEVKNQIESDESVPAELNIELTFN